MKNGREKLTIYGLARANEIHSFRTKPEVQKEVCNCFQRKKANYLNSGASTGIIEIIDDYS